MVELFITIYIISVVYNFIKYSEIVRNAPVVLVCLFYFACLFWWVFVLAHKAVKLKWAIEDNRLR